MIKLASFSKGFKSLARLSKSYDVKRFLSIPELSLETSPSSFFSLKKNFSSEEKKDDSNSEYVNIIFINKDNSEKHVRAAVGTNILEIAHANDIDLEGACEASCACSTCHVIFDPELYDKLPEASVSEEDMLDMAYGLTETSRLGCQVKVTKEFEGTKIKLPKATRNFYVDGHKPKPH